jgi:hypothetical protein
MRDKARVLGAVLLLAEVMAAMIGALITLGRDLAMVFGLLKTKHPFFLILQI